MCAWLLLEHRLPFVRRPGRSSPNLKAELKARQLETKVQVAGSGCMGLCSKGPLIRMTAKTQKDILFSDIKPEMAAKVVEQVVLPVLEGR